MNPNEQSAQLGFENSQQPDTSTSLTLTRRQLFAAAAVLLGLGGCASGSKAPSTGVNSAPTVEQLPADVAAALRAFAQGPMTEASIAENPGENLQTISPTVDRLKKLTPADRIAKSALPEGGNLEIYVPSSPQSGLYDTTPYLGVTLTGIYVPEPAGLKVNQAELPRFVQALPRMIEMYNRMRPEARITIPKANNATMVILPAGRLDRIFLSGASLVLTTPQYAIYLPGSTTNITVTLDDYTSGRTSVSQVGYTPASLNGIVKPDIRAWYDTGFDVELFQATTEATDVRSSDPAKHNIASKHQEEFANTMGKALKARRDGMTYDQYTAYVAQINAPKAGQEKIVEDISILTLSQEDYASLEVFRILAGL